ncbi:hypothetical protein KIK06_09415 [Nocardiopsis sp. EMB25]|uniref:hypothetical protein n=1 Tax=Nocardiopsis sp. EMB25 TaxID=2835867 RepID=UPI0022842961|nr:hypothetical protein [Nocardiopsis sp. EMB25]MCY9784110.1 hypothetical protein [Nocardiopsis sp. EMB25]
MTEVRALPTPILPKAADGVDTSIDAETPELLSDDRFDRRVETVSALLAAAGLEVSRSDSDPGHLNVDHPGTGFTVELDLREDRGFEWALRGDDEIEPGTTALRTASFVARLLSPEARS